MTRRSNVPSLVCAFLASATTGGSIYAFGLYGDALKKSLHITQLQLDTISATFFVAGLFSWIPGLVVDRMGMRFSMSFGGSAGAISVMLYWAVSRHLFVHLVHVVTILSILAVAICLSCGLIIGSTFKLTILCGGPDTQGSAVGVAKGFVGLGAGIYATIFRALRTADETALDFLPVIAVFFVLCAALPAWLLLPAQEEEASPVQIHTTPLHFRILYVSLLVLGIVIVVTSINDILKENDSSALDFSESRDYAIVALILILWLGPIMSLLYLPRKQEHAPTTIRAGNNGISVENGLKDSVYQENATTPSPGDAYDQTEDETKRLVVSSYQHDSSAPKALEQDAVELLQLQTNLNLQQMLQTPSAWLMLWTTTILVGSGTYKTNNMGQMVESLGFPEAMTSATLAIFSVAQAASRIVTGVASEAAFKWKVHSFCIDQGGVPRPFFLVIASAIAVLSHLMLVVSTSKTAFVIGCTFSGIAFGMAWPLMVLIVGDVFGMEHHGANYMFYDGVTKAVGTAFLSQYVAANVYEAHVIVDQQGSSTTSNAISCYGPACFRMTHMVVAVLSLTGVVASLALQYTSRHAYNHKRRLHAK